jgi:HD-GYP domain-containing protein (c-di-GMP phosphodiesterase class II)
MLSTPGFTGEGENGGITMFSKSQEIVSDYSSAASIETDVHELVEALTTAIDARYPYTKGHSDRVAELALAISQQMGLSREFGYLVHLASHLHDVGKIGIPDAILLKPGKLTLEEFKQITEHSRIGYEILHKVKQLQTVASIVRHHHERWDGRGYPDGLAAYDISLASRIIAVADSYDAMTSARSYRDSLSQQAALQELQCCCESQFDPAIVTAFLKINISQVLENVSAVPGANYLKT